MTGGRARGWHFLLGTAAALVLACCSAAPIEDARRAAEPAAIASTMCLDHPPSADVAACQARLPADLASRTAYANCLDYNRRDLRPCDKLRAAYEADLRAHLEQSPTAEPGQMAKLAPRVPTLPHLRELHQVAEDLYKASSRDAQTFEAALLIPGMRQKIEAALGQKLSASALQALVAKTRAEALYWYAYMQGLERLEQASAR